MARRIAIVKERPFANPSRNGLAQATEGLAIGAITEKVSSASRLAHDIDGCRIRYRALLKSCRNRMSFESVHGLRKEARRLQGMLELARAGLAGKPGRKALRRIRLQLRVLGPLRDTQVQLKKLRALSDRASALEPLFALLGRREDRLARKAAKKLKSRRLNKRIRVVEERLGALPANPPAERRFRFHLARLLSRARQRAATPPMDATVEAKKLHRARIAIKRYRSMLEALTPPAPGRTARELSRISKELSTLGQVHDLDVLLARVAKSAYQGVVAPQAAATLRERVESQRTKLLSAPRSRESC